MHSNPGFHWSFVGLSFLSFADALGEVNRVLQTVCLVLTVITLSIGLYKAFNHKHGQNDQD